MKNIIYENPQVKVYQYRAYLETILNQHKDYLEWLYSNYIQKVFYNEPINTISLDYFAPSILGACPLLNFDVIEDPDQNNNLHNNLQRSLKKGYYVYLFVDEYYVPQRESYGSYHFVHDVLIYGFDDTKKEYYLLGYDEKLNYKKSKVAFGKLKKAFENNDGINRMFLSKVKECNYKINKSNIVIQLEDYLYCRDSRDKKDMYLDMKNSSYDYNFYKDRRGKKAIFGIETYDSVVDYFKHCAWENSISDYRITYLLYEHSKLMRNRIKYFMDDNIVEKENDIDEMALNVENLARATFYLSLKVLYKENRQKLYEKIINNLLELKKEDSNLVKILIDRLKINLG